MAPERVGPARIVAGQGCTVAPPGVLATPQPGPQDPDPPSSAQAASAGRMAGPDQLFSEPGKPAPFPASGKKQPTSPASPNFLLEEHFKLVPASPPAGMGFLITPATDGLRACCQTRRETLRVLCSARASATPPAPASASLRIVPTEVLSGASRGSPGPGGLNPGGTGPAGAGADYQLDSVDRWAGADFGGGAVGGTGGGMGQLGRLLDAVLVGCGVLSPNDVPPVMQHPSPALHPP